MDADPNVLFGALAVQAGLLQPRQFAEAYQACSRPPGRPLADLLMERGWISAADRARVETVSHTQRDIAVGSDTACSTPKASSVADDSHNWTPPPPVAGPTRAQGETRPHTPGAAFPPAPTASAGPGDGTEPRYTWTRLHAKGGIGQVWLAHDANLEREVALKTLRPEAAERPALRARFVTEARITGQLEHPGVVPVYELSHRPQDGQPFYAMQFVRGRTLSEAVSDYHRKRAAGTARPLDLLALLNAFVAVCNTMAYAHARGVIHRDLKGQNVVLGDYGEVFVLDWGLAKRTRDTASAGEPAAGADSLPGDPEHTAEGQVLGTPAYMAPEQASGRLDAIDQRTDVYGLGAMLYEILTGRVPFQGGDTNDLLRKVREEAPLPPREVVAAAPAALEAVCLKALAKAPEQRYASGGDLGREVQRWLADEPVEAYPEPWGLRLGRWTRRHRPLVTGAAALLFTAVVALAVSTVLIGREQARTEAARLRAEENFRLARDAVDHYYVRVSKERLLNEPGLQRLRQDLLREARDFYQRFVAERGDDPDLQADLGRAYLQLGKVTAEIDSKPRALELFQKAAAVAQGLVDRQPGEPEYQQLLGECHNNQAVLYQGLGRLDEAERAFTQAIGVDEPLVTRFPEVDSYRGYLGLCYNNLGNLRRSRGRLGPAEDALHKSVDVLTPLVDRPQPDDQAAGDLAGTWTNLGILYAGRGQTDKAEAAFGKARDIREALVHRRPAVVDYRNSLASSYNNLGSLYNTTGARALARASLEKALAIRQEVADDNPAVTQYQEELAHVQLNLGNLDREQHQIRQAEAAYHKALAISTRLTAAHPEAPAFREGVGWAAYHLAMLLKDNGRTAEALKQYNEAIDAFQATPASRRGEGRQVFCAAYVGRAKVLGALHRPAESVADWDVALQLTDESGQKDVRTDRQTAVKQLMRHAAALASKGKYSKIHADVAAAARRPGLSGDVLYWLARVPAMVVTVGRTDQRLSREQAVQSAGLALALLRRARAAGYFEDPARRQLLQTDPALAGLRGRAEFRELVRPGQEER